MKKIDLRIVISLLIVSWISFYISQGCRPNPINDKIPLPNYNFPLSKNLQNVPIDIYYDATPSMEGFVPNNNLGANDDKFLDFISTNLQNAAPDVSNPRFFKFGNSVSVINNNIRDEIRSHAFFNSSQTYLDSVIQRCDTTRLTIIATDLFQTDGDIARIVREITKKFLQRNKAVGLAAFLSEFDGIVYDIGPQRLTMKYRGLRPFYLLVLGDYLNIQSYFDKLNAMGIPFQERQFNIISNFIIDPPFSFYTNVCSIKATHNLVGRKLLSQSSPTLKGQFNLRNKGESYLVAVFNIKQLPYSLPIHTSKLDFVVSRANVYLDRDTVPKNVDNALFFDSDSFLSQTQYQMRFNIQESKLIYEGIYLFEIETKLSNTELPQWIQEWNMDISRIPKSINSPSTFEGNTTYNLQSFFQALHSNCKPFLGKLNLYIKKD
jgi:hypothetical protein